MEEKRNKFLIPGALTVAGVLIIGSLILSSDNNIKLAENTAVITDTTEQTEQPVQIQIGIQETDHILGNPDAEIILIGFSDFNCGFCGRFHHTIKQVMDEYGKDGQVAWIFRVFPISGEDGQRKAVAAECAAELGGNAKYWEFADNLFESTTRVNADQLPTIATEIGLDKTEFSQCLKENKVAGTVQNNYQSGIAAGVLGTPQEPGGTPHTLVLTKSGRVFPISGAQPYNIIKTMIDSILGEEGK